MEEQFCKFCHEDTNTTKNPLITPCKCTGTIKYVHHDCIVRWVAASGIAYNGRNNTVCYSIICQMCDEIIKCQTTEREESSLGIIWAILSACNLYILAIICLPTFSKYIYGINITFTNQNVLMGLLSVIFIDLLAIITIVSSIVSKRIYFQSLPIYKFTFSIIMYISLMVLTAYIYWISCLLFIYNIGFRIWISHVHRKICEHVNSVKIWVILDPPNKGE